MSKGKKCRHPLQVEIGGYSVVIVGFSDFLSKKKVRGVVRSVDVFLGLCPNWEDFAVGNGRVLPPLLQKYYNLYKDKEKLFEVESLLVIPVEDYSIDAGVFEVALKVLLDGHKLGFGCMSAHGRSGWLAARLIKELEGCSGDKAVRRIRKRFCKECVESQSQFDDLGCHHFKAEYMFADKDWWRDVYGMSDAYKRVDINTDNFGD